MMRPYCFFSNVELSICLYSVKFAALSWVRRDWFLLRIIEISFPMNSLEGGSSEIPIVVGAIPDRGDIPLDCFWVFVVAESSVYGFFPGVYKCPDVVECV